MNDKCHVCGKDAVLMVGGPNGGRLRPSCGDHSGFSGLVDKAIEKAVLDERKACAEIAWKMQTDMRMGTSIGNAIHNRVCPECGHHSTECRK